MELSIGSWGPRLVCLGICLGLVAVASPNAYAATATTTTNEVTFQAAPGEANDLTVATSAAAETVTFTENSGVGVTASGDCQQDNPSSATCSFDKTGSPFNRTIRIRLDDGDDQASVAPGSQEPLTFYGDAGNDTIVGGTANEFFNGGAGNDLLTGNSGHDSFNGGAGADVMDGGSGIGIDAVSYEERTEPISALIGAGTSYGNGGATDGADPAQAPSSNPAPGDTLTNMEEVKGGSGKDHLYGDSSYQIFHGGAGNDWIQGRHAPASGPGGVYNYGDAIDGGPGTLDVAFFGDVTDPVVFTLNQQTQVEVAWGGSGDDVLGSASTTNGAILIGGGGDDDLTGSPTLADIILDGVGYFGGNDADTADGRGGNDFINLGAGVDVINGGLGDDTLRGGAGFDTIDGGPGSDTMMGEQQPDWLKANDGEDDALLDCGGPNPPWTITDDLFLDSPPLDLNHVNCEHLWYL